MGEDGSPAVVRVCRADGAAMGAGFLVTPNLVVTCAHVLDGIEGSVLLEFPLLPRRDGEPVPSVTAEVLSLRPPQADDTGDTALLVVRTPLPPEAEPAPLAATSGRWDDEVRIFGFPGPYEHGVWVSGRLKSWQGSGWKQMESQPGHPAIAPGFSGSPVWSSRLKAVIGMTVATHNEPDATTAYLLPVERLAEAHPELAAKSPGKPPYRGLEPFLEEHADIFHGRATAIRRLAEAVESRPVVVLSGPSGSGKSSLVLAGLIPRLHMTVVRFRPDPVLTPSTMLASVLVPVLEPGLSEVDLLVEKEKLASRLSSPDMVALLARRLAERCPDGLLIFADQFEEIAAGDPESARTLFHLLISLVSAGPLRAVLTLRSASLDELLTADTASTLDHGTMLLAPMSRDELYAAVTGPVTAAAFEPGLVDRVLEDGRGRLPLVQFALTLLWEAGNGGLLTHASYDDLGGVSGALVSYAEQIYEERLSPAHRAGARRLFVQLARPEEDGSFSRRSARVAELDPELRPVVARLTADRLVVVDHAVDGAEIVDIVHQALIEQWQRLQDWLVEDREFRSWQEQLRQNIERWEELGRDQGSLLRGSALSKAQYWLAERGPDIPATQQKFIQDSGSRQKREVRVLRMVIAMITVLLLVVGGLGIVAWQANLTNESQLHTQASHLLGQEASRQLPDNPLTSLQLALSAWKNDNGTAESYEALLRNWLAMGAVTAIHNDLLEGELNQWSASTDGKVVATLVIKSNRKTVTVWTGLLDGNPKPANLIDVAGEVTTLAVSPDGKWLAIADIHNGVRLWSVADPVNPLLALRDRETQANTTTSIGKPLLKFSADGTHVLYNAGSSAGARTESVTVSVWDISGGKAGPAAEVRIARGFRQVAFGKDPRTLVLETYEEARLFDYATGAKLVDLPKNTQFLQPGTAAAICRTDGSLQLLDTATGAQLRLVKSENLPCSNVGEDITGRYVTTASSGRAAGGYQVSAVVDAVSGKVYTVPVPRGARDVTPLLVAPAGNGSVTVFAVVGRSVLRLTAPEADQNSLKPTALSPDGALAVGGADGQVRVFEARNGKEMASQSGRRRYGGLTVTSDGRRYITMDNTDLVVYSLAGFTEERRIGLPTPVLKCVDDRGFLWLVSPSPDETVVTCGTAVFRWNIQSGATAEDRLPVTDTILRALSRPAHPDEIIIVTRASIQIWAVRGRPVLVRHIAASDLTGALATADESGAWLAASVGDRQLEVWNLDEGNRVADTMPIDLDEANFVEFSPNGFLLTIHSSSSLEIWHIGDRKLWATAELPWSGPLDVHQNTLRLSGSMSVPLDPAGWYADLCRWASRPLTPEEQRLVPDGATTEPPCS